MLLKACLPLLIAGLVAIASAANTADFEAFAKFKKGMVGKSDSQNSFYNFPTSLLLPIIFFLFP